MRIRHNILIIFIALISSLCVSCVYFREGNIPSVSEWPIKTAKDKKAVSIIFLNKLVFVNNEEFVPPKKIHWTNFFSATIFSARNVEIWPEQLTIKAYKDSGLFSEVKIGKSHETDFQIENEFISLDDTFKISEYNNGISLWSCLLIPRRGRIIKYIVKSTIKDKNNSVLGTFVQSEKLQEWNEFFFIFARPFKNSVSVARDTFYDINRAIIYKAHTEGIF